jgi:hypothetical protein
MDLRQKGWGDMDWINLAPHRNQWRALVSEGSINCCEILKYQSTVSFSRQTRLRGVGSLVNYIGYFYNRSSELKTFTRARESCRPLGFGARGDERARGGGQ